MNPRTPERTGAEEAVCFTAGPRGAVFALGTIHAWLAADRLPPKVVAGISVGALSAAAFQKAFRELESLPADAAQDDRERARWRWFRTYLDAVSGTSLGVLWKAFPDPVDFFADQPPVRDFSRPAALKDEEREARLHYYRLTKLGIWLGGVPIRVSTIFRYITHYVRARENYAGGALQWLPMLWQGTKAGAQLLLYVAFKPLFISKWRFRDEEDPASARAWDSWSFRPLLGWKTWLAAVSQIASLLISLAAAFRWYTHRGMVPVLGTLLPFAVTAWIAWIIISGFRELLSFKPLSGRNQALGISMLRALDIEKGLLSDYELHKWLLELFGVTGPGAAATDGPVPTDPIDLVIVAASLQGILRHDGSGCRFEAVATAGRENLVDALRAALAVPGLFAPFEAKPENWGTSADQVMGENMLHLVDGSVFRQNPLPRLLSWLGQPGRPAVDTVRLIYNVPIEPRQHPVRRESVNIFQAAAESQRLERRRDTRQQARQVNFMSRLGWATGTAKTSEGRAFVTLEVTEVAPEDDISFDNFIAPTRQESRKHAAAGCRRTLEEIYGPAQVLAGVRESSCRAFLVSIAPGRNDALEAGIPGLPEICAECTGHLNFRSLHPAGMPDPGVERSFGTLSRTEDVNLHSLNQGYERLDGSRPAIVVLASGGVFRGATHIGFIAALVAAGVKADLVVGASVGALMGTVICAVADMTEDNQRRRVRELAGLFMHVDERAALTRQLKNALKQLGIRGRRIMLSPASVKRTLRRGTVSNPGFAATGAPPALIDAISQMFLIPHLETASIASQFVAGHFSVAIKRFWDQVQIETLPKLGIEHAAMGTSLLGPEARKLMMPATGDNGEWQGRTQPYNYSRFFCTTSDINRGAAMLLGRDTLRLTGSYDFLEACLSSSAFPVVFAARPESAVLPGTGRTDVLFADGGMFDNLPFFPATEVLTQVQYERTRNFITPEEVVNDLRSRNQHRHLIIAAALDAAPEAGYDSEHANINRIHKRAEALSTQVKSEEFARAARIVASQVSAFLAGDPCAALRANPGAATILNETVLADVMRVEPSDAEHINPTYAFCRTMGLREERLRKSIANGCFRTLLTMGREPHPLLPVIKAGPQVDLTSGKCAHFLRDGTSIHCPFAGDAETQGVYRECSRDKLHLVELQRFKTDVAN